MIRRTLISALLMAMAMTANAAPINLSTWTELTLDYAGGQPAGDWQLEAGNTAVNQVVNADPSMFLNNLNQTAYTLDGTWQVTTTDDDDYMGFVFGYQNSSNFYLFDWKQGTQGYQGTTAAEGMTVKKFTGATGDGLVDLSLAEFWENEHDFGDMDVLAQLHGSDKGWVDGVLYDFHLDFRHTNANEMRIIVERNSDSALLWDVTITDAMFMSGEFAFYNYSQARVRYAGFEQTGGQVVPEPASLLLLGLGLAALGFARRRS